MLLSTSLFLVVLFTHNSQAALEDCETQLPRIGDKKTDVYLKDLKWIEPNIQGKGKKVKTGETVRLECKNGFIDSDWTEKELSVGCSNGLYNRTLKFADLLCRNDWHKSTVVTPVSPTELGSTLLKCDDPNWRVLKVSQESSKGVLKHLYTVCQDMKTLRPKFTLLPVQNTKPQSVKNTFKCNDEWGFDQNGRSADERVKMSEGYVHNVQQNRITRLYPNKYRGKKLYPYTFNRGQLVETGDFSDDPDQRTTCQFVNVAPQWEVLNGNSWSLVEQEVRSIVQTRSEAQQLAGGIAPPGPAQGPAGQKKGSLSTSLIEQEMKAAQNQGKAGPNSSQQNKDKPGQPAVQPVQSQNKPAVQPVQSQNKPAVQPVQSQNKPAVQPVQSQNKPAVQPVQSQGKTQPQNQASLLNSKPSSSATEWEIYTGTYGNIPTEKGTMFLSPIYQENGKFVKSLLPVPMLFWKMAYNTKDRTKTRVFIGVNNPDFKEPSSFPPAYKLCQVKTFKGDEHKGYTYECPLSEFLTSLRSEKVVK